MSKIAIISQPDQGVLIDVSGCSTLKDALDHLSSTLQVSNQFWQGMNVSINLGTLAVQKDELLKILALAKSVGIIPAGVYSTSDETIDALKQCHIPLGSGKPMTLPAVNIDSTKITTTEIEEDRQKANPLATITMRVVDAVTRRNSAKEHIPAAANELEDMAREEFEDKEERQETGFPHMKAKRKVSLDGKKIQTAGGEPTNSAKVSKTASTETASATNRSEDTIENAELTNKVKAVDLTCESETEIEQSIEEVVSKEQKLFAPTVEMKTLQIPPTTVPSSEIAAGVEAAEPVKSKTVDQSIPKSEQEITGPHVEIKVMTIQSGDGMLEAQPAQKSIAQAATIEAEIFTQVDADCDLVEPEIHHATIQEDDVENAEEFEVEEGIETDTMDVGVAARSGPTTLYIHQNLRSGQTVSHKGHLVIIGDINPGAEVMADGDITIWGCLRGVAHAGIGGNVNAEIRALNLQPIQIRIAHAIARAPDRQRVNYATTNGPETARMVDGKIRVVKSRLD